jgi:predicted transposase/invertase (TIGR01784 family)
LLAHTRHDPEQQRELLLRTEILSGLHFQKTMIEQVFREIERMLAIEESAGYQRIFEQGLEQGLEQGIEKAKRDTARQMKAKGLTPELIAEVTGLSLSEVQAL